MISKELLEVVLGDAYNPRLVESMQEEDNCLCTYYSGKYDEQDRHTVLGIKINIYKLAHLCKEWAVAIKTTKLTMYSINSYLSNAGSTVCDISCSYENELLDIDDTDYTKRFSAESEPEAVFAACEWVLKETNVR